MKLNRCPELLAFFASAFLDTDMESDVQTTRDFVAEATPEKVGKILAQASALLADSEFPLDEIGAEANRWFSDEEEARNWLESLLPILEESGTSSGSDEIVVKDSNGAPLSEGDSVTVIKDLKVKGGSSDLKRGTLIKKIHLIGDPDNIECRVDGSTLVLKTMFLKKA
jgi:protein PhnA